MPLPLTEIIKDQPEQPVARFLLTHGAGASVLSDFMQQLTLALVAKRIEVWRFNFPYMQQQLLSGKKRLPDKVTALELFFRKQLQQCPDDLPLFCGGKSMGGRVASMLISPEQVKGIFAYGYPFCPPGKTNWRTEHFSRLQCPLFIIQGERDPFGNSSQLADKHWPRVVIHRLLAADHDFMPLKKTGLTQQLMITQAADFTSEKINECILEM